MKKLLALLLAVCLLLPSVAFADAVTTRVEMQIGEESARALLSDMLIKNGAEVEADDVDTVANFICGVLEIAAIEYTAQENGFEFTILLKDQPLFSAGVTLEEAEMVLSTSVLKDRVIVVKLPDEMKKAASFDWNGLLSDMSVTVRDWYASRDITFDPIGNFAGTAYDDGDERILIRVDDMDIALLVEGLLLDAEQHELPSALSDMLGADAVSDLLREIRTVNYKAAIDNAFDYELAVVYRHGSLTNEFAGASLNVFYKDELAWSLSVGQKDGQVQLIGAFHVDGKTNYFAMSEKVDKLSSKESATKHMFAVYQADAGSTYATASADSSKALVYSETNLTAVVTGTSAHYRRDINGAGKYIFSGETAPAMRFEATEEYAESPFSYKLEAKTYPDDGADAAVTYRISRKPAASFVHPDGAERIDFEKIVNDAVLRDEIITQITNEGVAEMGVIAFKSIPAELLLQLMQLMQ